MPAQPVSVPPPASPKLNLLGLTGDELVERFESLGQRPYRAKQIMRWIYGRGVLDFESVTDLSRALRAQLADTAELALPRATADETAADGTRKWLLDVGGSQGIEAVFIPEPSRGTLCISSQAGCVLDCSFCATGRQGFNRNLSAAEIAGQVVMARNALDPTPITNVVFMGMGEPLANYRNVLAVTRLLLDDYGLGLSRRRVTISTSGLVPQMRRLAEECNVALAVSLHAAYDDLRNELVPINRVHPIEELLDACWQYAEVLASRQVTFEYVMLDGVNDSVGDAKKLARLLRGRPAKVNLIPFNEFPGTEYRCSSAETIDRFWQTLWSSGVVATIRRPRGDDIAAACGQLAGRIDDRRTVRLSDKLRGASRI